MAPFTNNKDSVVQVSGIKFCINFAECEASPKAAMAETNTKVVCKGGIIPTDKIVELTSQLAASQTVVAAHVPVMEVAVAVKHLRPRKSGFPKPRLPLRRPT